MFGIFKKKESPFQEIEIDWKEVPQEVANQFLFGLILGGSRRVHVEFVKRDFPDMAQYIKVKKT